MNNVGQKIYFQKSTGDVLVRIGEKSGETVQDTTVEQDFLEWNNLNGRNPESVGYIKLEYGQYAQDFNDCNGFRVDITTTPPTLVFSYPDPNAPEEPPVYQKPLTEQIRALEAKDSEIILTLVMNDLM